MRGNTARLRKGAVFIGGSYAFLVCWLFLQLSKLSGGDSALHPILFVPFAFSGLFASVIILRFLIKKHFSNAELGIRLAGAALGVALAFFRPTSVLSAVIAFILMLFFFFPFIRGLLGQGAGTDVFVVFTSVFTLSVLSYVRLIAPAAGGRVAHIVLSLLLPAASMLLSWAAQRLDCAANTPEESQLPKRMIWFGLAVSLVGVLVSISGVVFIRDAMPEYMTETGIAGTALCVLTLFFMLWLLGKGKIWQAIYMVLASFAIGALLSLVQWGTQNLFLIFLPLMMFFMSGTGMLALFFDFCRRCVSPLNSQVACGVAYVVIYSLLGLYLTWVVGGLSFPEWLSSGAATALTAVVLLLSPAMLRWNTVPTRDDSLEDSNEFTEEESGGGDELEEMTYKLTNSEKKVFKLIIVGYSNQQIADELFISINTVKFHIKNVLAKIGVQRKKDLLALYAQIQLRISEKQEG